MDNSNPSRRDVLAGAACLALTPSVSKMPPAVANTFVNVARLPDLVRVLGEDGEIAVNRTGAVWEGKGASVEVAAGVVRLRGTTPVTRIHLRWRGDLRAVQSFLGDHWERGYGDLQWRSEAPNRVMPWYFLAYDGRASHGYGVLTQPNAMCFWTADCDGISLWADVRNGTSGVSLGARTLEVCRISARECRTGESPFAAARALCAQLCPKPRLAAHRVYGTNDWYYAYGQNSADLIMAATDLVSKLSPDATNRPYSVIDDGWSQGGLGHGPWQGNERFGPMDRFAERIRQAGARPGIWFRPLTPTESHSTSMRSMRSARVLDPTVPEVLEWVSTNVSKIRSWGYELIKHDYSSFDMFGRWGSTMGSDLTSGEWHFADRSKTNAEIALDLFRTIRKAAKDALVIGCNTFSHLSAGLFEIQRAGDDTSGRSWDRTRRMGVNTLAFRAPQHDTFYAVDADVVAITQYVPWDLTERWMQLVAASGTPFFVSPEAAAMGTAQNNALRSALTTAAKPLSVAEPLDWMTTMCPRQWRVSGRKVWYDWMPASGSWPFAD